MQAKDRDRILREILGKYPGTDPEIDIDWDMVEIAFWAGYEQSVLDNDEWCHDGVLKGRREVVEWITEHYFDDTFSDEMMDEWQAQCKDWGIDG